MKRICVLLSLMMTSFYFAQQIPGRCQEGKYGEKWIVGNSIGTLECKTDDSWHYRGLALEIKKDGLKDISFEDDLDIWESNMFVIWRKNRYGEYEKVMSADFATEYQEKVYEIIDERVKNGDVVGVLMMYKE